MKNLSDFEQLYRSIITEEHTENEENRYMFFESLVQMKRQCDLLLSLEKDEINDILENGHDWAEDHITQAKSYLDQVFDFIMNQLEEKD